MIKKQYYKAYPIDKNKLNRNRWMFIEEGIERGYDIKRIHYKKLIIHVAKDGRGFMYDTLPGAVSIRMRLPYITNKTFQKQIMKANNISVAETLGVAKTKNDLTHITHEFPCVVKPVRGTLAKNVFVDVDTEEKLHIAVKKILHSKSVALVEKQYNGKQYRILVINGKFISCVQRCPAYIVGDGIHTVQELIDIKNANPERGGYNSKVHTLRYIVINDLVKNKLKKNHILLSDIIDDDKKIIFDVDLPHALDLGGDMIDETDNIHQTFIEKSEHFTQKHNFFIIGFDVIAEDITKDVNQQKYIFNELNEQPFFDINEKCNIGTGPPVASIMWDEIEKGDIMTEKFLLF